MQQLITLLVKHSRLVLLGNALLVALLAAGAGRLSVESGVKVFFSEDDPNLLAQEVLEARYGRPDNILVVLDAGDSEIFTTDHLRILEDVTTRAWQVPHSRRVDSIANYQHPYVDGDDIIIEPLVYDAAAFTPTDIDRVRRIALGEPLLVGRLISADGRVAGINITLNLPLDDKAAAVAKAVGYVRDLQRELREQAPTLAVHLAGWAVTEQTLVDVTTSDGTTLMPVLFAIVLALLAFLLRSASASIITLVAIVLAVAAGMGFAGWCGMRINNVNVSAPTIIMTLAIADCVHVFSVFLQRLRTGLARAAALEYALGVTAYPIFLTSVTTALGFLSMNLSESPPFRELGTIAAAGSIAALWITFTIVPGLIMSLPFRPGAAIPRLRLGWLSKRVIKNHNALFYASLALIALAVLALTRLELNDDPAGYFAEAVPLKQAIDVVESRLSGTQDIYYEFDTGTEDGILEPEFLGQVDAFASWLRGQPPVVNVEVFTDTLKRLNQVMHDDSPQWRKLPDERALAAQYTLLYELSVPYGLDTTDRISANKSALKLTATLRGQKSRELIDFEANSRQWLTRNAPALATYGAGPAVSFAHVGMRNIQSMLYGSLLALVLISLCLVAAFRSVRYGLLSLVPNLFPALTALGIWALIRGEVNMAASVVFSLTLGIIVDDTTHFMVKYLEKRRQPLADAAAAISHSMETVGTALVTTSIVLVAGFLVLVTSNFMVNATSGLLVAITISLAIVLDLVFLPCLLLKVDRWLEKTPVTT